VAWRENWTRRLISGAGGIFGASPAMRLHGVLRDPITTVLSTTSWL
jgi:hypothetical protein